MTFEELHDKLMEAHPPTPTNLILYPELYRDYLDDRDQVILRDRQEARDKRRGEMMQGDFVRFSDGSIRIISHVWDDGVQTSKGGSIFLCSTGGGSFSGSLDTSTPKELFTLSEDRMEGHFWFFHHNSSGAGRGKNCKVECQVWDCASLPPKF